ncbi:hypothetical protein GLUCOINTEAF2_0203770 [Komagataeibacter intermedius AF2]|uniref:Uncharacterized protein n=1 Tax=Komagataeibacter intermedius AF2 TaxID=1458464 RepID=A0A0N1FDC4_9PROT|nr:hypothetical protein GLUCOINTEAF2_0203770 [Komagataeibacter intermedius AF2]
MAKDSLNNTAFTPTAQTPVDVFPVPETAKKITPRDAGAIAIQHGFHEQAVVRCRAADMTIPTGEKIFYPLPLIVT